MKITKIELQKNDNERYNLYSGDQYIMSVNIDNLTPYGFVEFEISPEELEELRLKEEYDLARKISIKYISRAMKSSKEVRDYLYKKKIDPQIHDKVIFYLEDLGLLDDNKYLEIFLDDHFNYRSDGSKKIKHKLYQKGFASSDVDPFLEDYKEKERENLRELIKTRRASRKNEDKDKLIRYLMNKGYDYSMIRDEIGDIFDGYWSLRLYPKV